MVRAPELLGGEWVQGGPVSVHGLRGKVLLLDFFTFGCINCVNNLSTLLRLRRRYGEALQVIGVHSGKFAYEKELAAVSDAMERLGVAYPVVNDPQGRLVDQYAVKAWPTMVLVDARGYVAAEFRGEAQGVSIDLALQKLGLVPVDDVRPRTGAAPSRLHYPEAVAEAGGRVYVAHGGGDVREYAESGNLLRRFARFKDPCALAVFDGVLYIADGEGGSLSRIDLSSEERTVLFEGLRSPSAVTVDERSIAVAEAGAHRITVFDRESLEPLQRFGNRFEALRDGFEEAAQLAQPMGMALCDDGTLWFVDAESSSLRYIDGNRVETAVGEGLFTFGDSDEGAILLQHPQGVACGRIGDGCGGGRVFVADTYNGKIKAFDPTSGRMMTLAEGLREPVGICKVGCRIYIAERAAHRVIRLDLSSMRLETFAS